MRTCKRKHKYEIELDDRGKNKGCPECRKLTLAAYHQRRKAVAGFLEKHKINMAKHYKLRGNSEEARIAQRANRLRSRYWPTLNAWQALAEYEKMLANQDYCCKICEVHQEQYDVAFHVDHCHATGKVRGLLCAVCNKHIVGGIDIRAKAKKVYITKKTLLTNVLRYFEETDPEYKADVDREKAYEKG